MPKSNVNNCSQLVRIFALSSCAFLLSDQMQFCSRTVRNFALRPYAILLLDRTQFCSRTVRNFALRPLLVLIFALKPLLVPATYRATVDLCRRVEDQVSNFHGKLRTERADNVKACLLRCNTSGCELCFNLRSHTSGSVGQKGGSLMLTADTVVVVRG